MDESDWNPDPDPDTPDEWRSEFGEVVAWPQEGSIMLSVYQSGFGLTPAQAASLGAALCAYAEAETR